MPTQLNTGYIDEEDRVCFRAIAHLHTQGIVCPGDAQPHKDDWIAHRDPLADGIYTARVFCDTHQVYLGEVQFTQHRRLIAHNCSTGG